MTNEVTSRADGTPDSAGSPPLVSVLIITRNRHDELPASVASVFEQSWKHVEVRVLENGSDEQTVRSNREALARWPSVIYTEASQNLGVAGGRNQLLSEAQGEIILELDDDAVFAHEHVLARAVECLQQHPTVGIVAFRITNYHSMTMTRKEYPFRDKSRDPERPGPCAWFIGAGHAFRHELLEHVGIYREFFPYGSEEQDLAIRTLSEGYDIYYLPEAHVLHKQTPKARIANTPELGGLLLAHRTKAALLNLPWLLALSIYLIRGLQMSVRYGSPSVYLKAAARLRADIPYIRRTRRVVDLRTLLKIHHLRGMLFY